MQPSIAQLEKVNIEVSTKAMKNRFFILVDFRAVKIDELSVTEIKDVIN
jgi:ABC-type lipopolysaccharide export system ATPase subunit